MFPNLKAEMIRFNITCEDIGTFLGTSISWVENRLQGKAALPINIGMQIKNKFFPDLPLEYLFSSTPMQPINISIPHSEN